MPLSKVRLLINAVIVATSKCSALSPQQKGLGLIELLIAVAILSLLFGLALPSYSAWIQSNQIRSLATALEADLQQARLTAIQRNDSVIFTFAGTSGWAASMVGTNEVLFSRASAAEIKNAVVTSYNPSITFDGSGRASSAGTISLTNPTGGTCAAAAGPMRCLNLRVSAGGRLRLCDPLLPAGDPQACA